MEVSTCGDGSGKEIADGVDGLEDALNVAAARYFLDENGRETLGAELLVHTEEVDFGGVEDVLADAEFDWDARDEGDKFS